MVSSTWPPKNLGYQCGAIAFTAQHKSLLRHRLRPPPIIQYFIGLFGSARAAFACRRPGIQLVDDFQGQGYGLAPNGWPFR